MYIAGLFVLKVINPTPAITSQSLLISGYIPRFFYRDHDHRFEICYQSRYITGQRGNLDPRGDNLVHCRTKIVGTFILTGAAPGIVQPDRSQTRVGRMQRNPSLFSLPGTDPTIAGLSPVSGVEYCRSSDHDHRNQLPCRCNRSQITNGTTNKNRLRDADRQYHDKMQSPADRPSLRPV